MAPALVAGSPSMSAQAANPKTAIFGSVAQLMTAAMAYSPKK